VLPASLAPLERLGRRDLLENGEIVVYLGLLACPVHPARLASLVPQACREEMERLVHRDFQDLRAIVDSSVFRVFLALLDLLARRDLQEKMAKTESQDLREAEDHQDLMVRLVPQVTLDPWAQEELLERRAREDLLGSWDLMDHLDLLGRAVVWTWQP